MSDHEYDMEDGGDNAHRDYVKLNKRRPIEQVRASKQQVNDKGNSMPQESVREGGRTEE
jgi:hypothetical protein